jgi:hypothetical protein
LNVARHSAVERHQVAGSRRSDPGEKHRNASEQQKRCCFELNVSIFHDLIFLSLVVAFVPG